MDLHGHLGQFGLHSSPGGALAVGQGRLSGGDRRRVRQRLGEAGAFGIQDEEPVFERDKICGDLRLW
ncbi:hypothetical protein ACFQ9X_17235 [Catenulispora yoronensis]